jgi:hypothetical protein
VDGGLIGLSDGIRHAERPVRLGPAPEREGAEVQTDPFLLVVAIIGFAVFISHE